MRLINCAGYYPVTFGNTVGQVGKAVDVLVAPFLYLAPLVCSKRRVYVEMSHDSQVERRRSAIGMSDDYRKIGFFRPLLPDKPEAS